MGTERRCRAIGVTAQKGVVSLSGSVGSYPEKMAAERAAKKVNGVLGIANELGVVLPGTAKRGDADIAAAALNVLKWNTLVPDDRIQVTVTNGWLTLEGKVDWSYQRTAAENAVRALSGVVGFFDKITVQSRVSPVDLKNKIEAAFKRSAELDAQHVQVSADAGKVTLRGNVHSLAEKHEAEQVAWAAPGVYDVDNLIAVVA